jgi:hypothetical protein
MSNNNLFATYNYHTFSCVARISEWPFASHMIFRFSSWPAPNRAIHGGSVQVIGGAFLMGLEIPEDWQPWPGCRRRWPGVALLVAMLWHGQQMADAGGGMAGPARG